MELEVPKKAYFHAYNIYCHHLMDFAMREA